MTNPPASPAPYPEDAAERADAIRRRALPIAISALLCGIAGIALLYTTPVAVGRPPNIFGVNLSFCAMLMGIGIIFYARGTTRTTAAVILSIAALIAGFVGPLIFTKQTVDFKAMTESGELQNVVAIQAAARAYAESHGGAYPPDMATLLESKLITPTTLHSPYEAGGYQWPDHWESHAALQKLIDQHADFNYLGTGIQLSALAHADEAAKQDFPHIVVAAKKYPIARKEISVAFADGHAAFIGGEDWQKTWDDSNAARKSLGFPEIERPSTSTDIDIPAPEPTTAQRPE